MYNTKSFMAFLLPFFLEAREGMGFFLFFFEADEGWVFIFLPLFAGRRWLGFYFFCLFSRPTRG
jgi:hypothetical protein